MKAIYSSATKIALILLTLTACTGFLVGFLPPERFMELAMMAFAFYYSRKDPTHPIQS